MKANDIRKMEKVKILEKLKSKRLELANKKLEKYIGKEKNTSGLRLLKHDIAKFLTILNEKEALNE